MWNFVLPISYRAHARPTSPPPPFSLHLDRFYSSVLILSFEYISPRVRNCSVRVCTVQTRIPSLPCVPSRPLDSPRALRRLVTAVFLTMYLASVYFMNRNHVEDVLHAPSATQTVQCQRLD